MSAATSSQASPPNDAQTLVVNGAEIAVICEVISQQGALIQWSEDLTSFFFTSIFNEIHDRCPRLGNFFSSDTSPLLCNDRNASRALFQTLKSACEGILSPLDSAVSLSYTTGTDKRDYVLASRAFFVLRSLAARQNIVHQLCRLSGRHLQADSDKSNAKRRGELLPRSPSPSKRARTTCAYDHYFLGNHAYIGLVGKPSQESSRPAGRVENERASDARKDKVLQQERLPKASKADNDEDLPSWKQQRLAAKDQRSAENDRVQQALFEEAQTYLAFRRQVISSSSRNEGKSRAQQLRNVLDALLESHQMPSTHEGFENAWKHRSLSENFVRYQLEALQNPLWLEESAFESVLDASASKSDEFAHFYVRGIQANKDELKNLLREFGERFPAHKWWSRSLLLELEKAPRVNFFRYEGCSTKYDALERQQQDMNGKGSCWTNFLRIVESNKLSGKLRAYTYKPLAKAVATAKVRPDDMTLNGLEVLGIIAIHGVSGNSSCNSLRCFKGPSEMVQTLRSSLKVDRLYLSGDSPDDVGTVTRSLEGLVEKVLRFAQQPDNASRMQTVVALNSVAHREIKANITSLPVWHGGRPLSLHIPSEIPIESAKGQTSYSGVEVPAGRSPHLYWQHVKALFASKDDAISSIRDLGPTVDFLFASPSRAFIPESLAFLVLELNAIRPLVIEVDGGPVSNMLRLGLTEPDILLRPGAFEQLSCLKSFTQSSMRAALKSRWSSLTWRSLEPLNWILRVGDMFLIRWGPNDDDFSIVVCQFDGGHLAFDPTLESLAMQLFDLVLLKEAWVKTITAVKVKRDGPASRTNGIKWFVDLLAEARRVINDSSLQRDLVATRFKFYERKAALTSDRNQNDRSGLDDAQPKSANTKTKQGGKGRASIVDDKGTGKRSERRTSTSNANDDHDNAFGRETKSVDAEDDDYNDQAMTIFVGAPVRDRGDIYAFRKHKSGVIDDDLFGIIRLRPWGTSLRGRQMLDILHQQRSADERGVGDVIVPSPDAYKPGTWEWIKWFIEGGEGKQMNRSAAKAGTKPEFSTEQREAMGKRLAKGKAAFYGSTS